MLWRMSSVLTASSRLRRVPPLPRLLIPAGPALQHVAAAGACVPICLHAVRPPVHTCPAPTVLHVLLPPPLPPLLLLLLLLLLLPLYILSDRRRPPAPSAPQLILPVGVHTLVSEKEQHLRVMMKMQVGLGFGSTAASASNSAICEGVAVFTGRLATSPACWWPPRHNATSSCMPRHNATSRCTPCLRLPAGDHASRTFMLQGLSDGPYYVVMWAWHLLLYCAFVMVFCIFGGLIGLKVLPG